jgi:hypothetical protein
MTIDTCIYTYDCGKAELSDMLRLDYWVLTFSIWGWHMYIQLSRLETLDDIVVGKIGDRDPTRWVPSCAQS